jgi:anti-anti-sigma factor
MEPQGRLDALGARGLWDEFEPLLERRALRVLVDMSQARYISSDGLRVLMRASKSVKQNAGRLVLCCVNARIAEIVSMAGLEQVLEIYPSRAAAERALEDSAPSAQ